MNLRYGNHTSVAVRERELAKKRRNMVLKREKERVSKTEEMQTRKKTNSDKNKGRQCESHEVTKRK